MRALRVSLLVVFNTHADYDHIWGNQAFGGSTIVAHESALRRIRRRARRDSRSTGRT